MLEKQEKRHKRHRRGRAKIFGRVSRPRLSVFKSAKHIYAQLIDDEKGQVLVAANDQELKSKTSTVKRQTAVKNSKKEEAPRSGKVKVSFEVGKLVAEKALKKKIEKVIFDRGGYKYHGRVKAVAEGAREGGLNF